MKQRARELRQKQTDAEQLLWRQLRNRQMAGHKFRRQETIGPYIVDFVCLDAKLIIEIDGGQHGEQMEYDIKRSAYLKQRGYRVLRFWNDEVLKDTNTVLERIHAELINSPHPHPLPEGEGENFQETKEGK